MRRIFVLTVLSLCLFLANPVMAQDTEAADDFKRFGGTVKFGYDLSGTHEVSAFGITVEEDVESGISVGGEFLFHANPNIDFGIGLSHQLERSFEDVPAEFQFTSLYGTVRLKTNLEPVDPYICGQLGYGYLDGDSDYRGTGIYEADLEGDLYYGLGLGAIINKHFLIELLYTVNEGTGRLEYFQIEGDIRYEKMTMNIGVNF